MLTLRETIRDITDQHLDKGYMVAGQCLTAVGWVGGTLPERHDMTELPTADVAGAGFVVGMALAGKRPIYVIRYQGFTHYNGPMIVNYAAKSKDMWGRPCPILVRSIAMEGGIGPVAGSSHHSLFTRMPGVKVFAPMTPREWRDAYQEFMSGDDVVYLSEHRGAYDTRNEFLAFLGQEEPELLRRRSGTNRPPDIVLIPISITRTAAINAAQEMMVQNIAVAVHPAWCLKPLQLTSRAFDDLERACYGGIVIDDDYEGGVASDIAIKLHAKTGATMRVLGLKDRTAGFSLWNDNLPPNKETIKEFILDDITAKSSARPLTGVMRS